MRETGELLISLNAGFCVYFMYKYKQTKDITLFKKAAIYFFFPFLIIDLFLNIYLINNNSEKKTYTEAILHHIISFLLAIFSTGLSSAVPARIDSSDTIRSVCWVTRLEKSIIICA